MEKKKLSEEHIAALKVRIASKESLCNHLKRLTFERLARKGNVGCYMFVSTTGKLTECDAAGTNPGDNDGTNPGGGGGSDNGGEVAQSDAYLDGEFWGGLKKNDPSMVWYAAGSNETVELTLDEFAAQRTGGDPTDVADFIRGFNSVS